MGEQWRPVIGFEGLYEVSKVGRVKSLARTCQSKNGSVRTVPEKLLRASPWGPYLCVTLFRDGCRLRQNIQWIVVLAFIGPKLHPDWEVCHDDGDYHNNCDWNLRYDTRAGNFADKVRHGTHQRGERHGNAKLTDQQAMAILQDGRRPQEIAPDYGVSDATVYLIKNRTNWRHLAGT